MRLLIGLILILTSPMILIFVGEQNRAGDFSTLEIVDSAVLQEGDLIVYGDTQTLDELKCPESEEVCVYVSSTTQIYTREEKIVCEELPEGVELVEQVEDRCDGATDICDPCYRVASHEWENSLQEVDVAAFMVGEYKIEVNEVNTQLATTEKVIFQEFDEEEEGDERIQYDYLPLSEKMLAAGNVQDGVMNGRSESGVYFVSQENPETVLEIFKQKDKAARNGIRFMSLVVMMLGFVVLTSQVSGPLLGVFRMIPALGGFMEKGSKAAVVFLSAVIGAIVWFAIFLPLSLIIL